MQYADRKGFTLIELLVVIAIIAILGAILLPAINGVRKKGYEARARTEVKSLETALKAYLNEYNRYPEFTGSSSENNYRYGVNRDNRFLVQALRGTDINTNPRKIVFIELSEKALDSSGNMVDPWNNQYRVSLDLNFDNYINTGDGNVNTITGRNVAVWTVGSDSATNSYIRSWE